MKKLYYTVYLNFDRNTKFIKVYEIIGEELILVISFTIHISDMTRQEINSRISNVSSLILI